MKKQIFILVSLLMVSLLFAQDNNEPWQIGPHAAFAFPTNDHIYGSTAGEGLGVKIIYNIKELNFISPRIDILYLSYGEKRSSATDGASPYSILIKTRHESFQLTLGAQISTSKGSIRPYISPLGGLFNYRSVVTLPELYYYYGYPAMDTRKNQWALGARGQAGVLFDIGLGPLIDVSMTYQHIFDVKIESGDETFNRDAGDLMINIGVMLYIDN